MYCYSVGLVRVGWGRCGSLFLGVVCGLVGDWLVGVCRGWFVCFSWVGVVVFIYDVFGVLWVCVCVGYCKCCVVLVVGGWLFVGCYVVFLGCVLLVVCLCFVGLGWRVCCRSCYWFWCGSWCWFCSVWRWWFCRDVLVVFVRLGDLDVWISCVGSYWVVWMGVDLDFLVVWWWFG